MSFYTLKYIILTAQAMAQARAKPKPMTLACPMIFSGPSLLKPGLHITTVNLALLTQKIPDLALILVHSHSLVNQWAIIVLSTLRRAHLLRLSSVPSFYAPSVLRYLTPIVLKGLVTRNQKNW